MGSYAYYFKGLKKANTMTYQIQLPRNWTESFLIKLFSKVKAVSIITHSKGMFKIVPLKLCLGK